MGGRTGGMSSGMGDDTYGVCIHLCTTFLTNAKFNF